MVQSVLEGSQVLQALLQGLAPAHDRWLTNSPTDREQRMHTDLYAESEDRMHTDLNTEGENRKQYWLQ